MKSRALQRQEPSRTTAFSWIIITIVSQWLRGNIQQIEDDYCWLLTKGHSSSSISIIRSRQFLNFENSFMDEFLQRPDLISYKHWQCLAVQITYCMSLFALKATDSSLDRERPSTKKFNDFQSWISWMRLSQSSFEFSENILVTGLTVRKLRCRCLGKSKNLLSRLKLLLFQVKKRDYLIEDGCNK